MKQLRRSKGIVDTAETRRTPEERRRRRFRFILASVAFVVFSTALEVFFFARVAPTVGSRFMFFLFMNLNIMALFWLMLFVARSLIKLAMERRQGIAGHKFKTKVVSIFLLITSLPLIIMFLVSGELVTNYIDRFFSPQFRKPVESSLKVAQTMYMLERMRALDMAALALGGNELPDKYRAVFIANAPDDASAAIQAALEGRAETEVITILGGDLIRAAVPVRGVALEGGEGAVTGALVVETSLPPDIMEGINSIKVAYDEYTKLEKWKSPLKVSYLMMLAFFTLVIIFVAIWIALRIAGWMTEPVKDLSMATLEVAAGNYGVRVDSKSQDEMGMLITSFNTMVQEISDNKESLEQAYANLDNIVRNIHSGVISIGADESVRSINGAACSMFGVTPIEVMGRNYRTLLMSMDSGELEEFIRSINTYTLKEVERDVWVSVAGRKALLNISVTSMRTGSGESFGLLVVVNDITDVVKAQRTLAWQEVARRMAHEIKNPLTPIKLSTERMLRKWRNQSEDLDAVMEKSTSTIIREVDSLKAMVDEFARFGKMPEVNRAPTDLRAVLTDVVNLYKGYKEVKVKTHMPQGGFVPSPELDAEQIKRVLINLFDNAIEAMGRQGAIDMSLSPGDDGSRVVIRISDTGPGIAPEDKVKLFQPYFSTRKDGTGLGLAIADKIIAEHGGTITVDDNTPTGSVFIIDMPAHA